MAVYWPRCHPQNSIWTDAKLRSIYYFVGDRPVHKLPLGPKYHELFVILYSIHANPVRRHVFVIVYLRQKTSSDKIRNKTLYWSGPVNMQKYWPVQYYTIIVFCIDTKDCNCFITLKWKVKVKPSQYEINHFIMTSYIMQWKVKVKASQYEF